LFQLPKALKISLNIQGVHFLVEIIDPMNTSIWNQGWMEANKLVLQGEEVRLWYHYMQRLKQSAMRIREGDDGLVWSKNIPGGIFTMKLGYQAKLRMWRKKKRSGG
jgi:hypothetical protein